MRMYKKISIGLILCAVLLPNIASAAAYSDIAGHLDEKYVVGYSDLGLVNGYPDSTFSTGCDTYQSGGNCIIRKA